MELRLHCKLKKLYKRAIENMTGNFDFILNDIQKKT